MKTKNVGKIVGFEGYWGSGIGTLVVENNDIITRINCENAQIVRVLDMLFPGTIGPGHTVNVDNIIGEWIKYEIDDLGILAGIAPWPLY